MLDLLMRRSHIGAEKGAGNRGSGMALAWRREAKPFRGWNAFAMTGLGALLH
jgi:hypothetical protein